ncbi:hypothetical protein D3C79_1115540 [compost metagenome]
MEHQIASDVGVEVAVIVTAADTQCFAQRHQILIGATQRSQADGLDFEDVPGFPRLLP